MHIAYKFPFKTVVTQVCKTLWKAMSFTAGSWCKWFQSLCRAPGAAYHLCAQHTHVIPCPPLSQLIFPVSAVIFYFTGLCLINGLVPLHLCVSEELQCLVGCTVEGTVATDRTEPGEALEAIGQVVGWDKVRCFWGISSVLSVLSQPSQEVL